MACRLRVLLAVLLLLAGTALALRVEVETDPDDETSRLELRNLTLPDGRTVQLWVLEAEQPFTIRFEANVVRAKHVEFDLSQGVLRVIGTGSFESPEQRIEGEDFVVEIEAETLVGRNVFIFTEAIDVKGATASRVPGQIDILSGRFSPCSRCNQEVEDYSFRAAKLQLYPGDRLIAFEVTVLVRELPVMWLPVLVVPLGPPERQPRLSIRQGTATTRAEIALDWPYTFGPDAFGSVSLRFYHDVIPGEGTLFSETLFGGRVIESYMGGAIRHRFYTEQGTGRFELGYVPSFIDRRTNAKTLDQITLRFGYTTLEAPKVPSLELLIERDDARRQRLAEYRFGVSHSTLGLSLRMFSQGYIDLDPALGRRLPSYDARTVPERTLLQLTLTPEGSPTYSVGPFRLSALQLDLGVFEDASNPANRAVARLGRVSAARLLAQHQLRLEPLPIWPGLTLTGDTRFRGHYYTSGERLIDWPSQLTLRQAFGQSGNLSLSYIRNTTEGQTPFRFDLLPLRTRSELRSALELRPLPWLGLSANQTYVFRDNRSPRLEGPGPLNTRLSLFDNLSWFSLRFENRYDLREGDPGRLVAEAVLRAPDPQLTALLGVRHAQDLRPTPDRLTGELINDTETDVRVEFGLAPYLRFDLRGGYTYNPPVGEDGVREFQKPLELGLTLGTLDTSDNIPGLRVAYQRDTNRRELRELGLQFAARIDPVEISVEQRINVQQGRLGTTRYRVSWPGVASLEASGFALIPPAWLGLTLDEHPESWRFDLRDAPTVGRERWRLSYRTRLNPALEGGEGGFEQSQLEAFVNLDEQRVGEVTFRLDFYLDLRPRDTARPRTFVQRSSLGLGVQFGDRVGIQGALAYAGTYNPATDELTRSALTFSDFAITVRALDTLYLGAIFNDVWDFSGNVPRQSPWNFQPTLFVVWDRCCWALYGSWNTMTGAVRLAVSAPGGGLGLEQELDTPITLPGRGEP